MKKKYFKPIIAIVETESHFMASSPFDSKIPVEKDEFADDSPILAPEFDTSLEW